MGCFIFLHYLVNNVTFGNSIRPVGDVDADLESVIIPNPQNGAPVTGKLLQWSVYSRYLRNMSLQVWRPMPPEHSQRFMLVYQSGLTSLGSPGAHSFSVSNATILKGDVLGIQVTHGGTIPYSRWQCGLEEVPSQRHHTHDVPLTDNSTYTFTSINECRDYSISATIKLEGKVSYRERLFHFRCSVYICHLYAIREEMLK